MVTRKYDIFPRIRAILTFALLCCILCGCGKEAFSKNDPGPNMGNQSMTEQDTITGPSSTAETDNNSLPKQDEPLSVLNPGKHFRLRYIANHPIDVSYDAKALSSGVLLGGLSEKDGKLQFGSYHYTLDGRSGSSGPVEERFTVSDYCCYVDEEGGTLQILLLTETKADNSLAYFIQMGSITLDLSPWTEKGIHYQWVFPVEDSILLAGSDGDFLLVSLSGETVCEHSASVSLLSAVQRSENDIVFCGTESQFRYTLYGWDADSQTLKELCVLPEELKYTRLFSGLHWGYDLLACDTSWIYGWNIGDAALNQIVSLDEIGLAAGDIVAIAALDRGVLIGTCESRDGSGERLFWIEEIEDLPKKTEIVIGGLSRPMDLSSAMADFVQQYPEYQLEYRDYNALYGDQALTRLQLDLLYDDCPDLLLLNGTVYDAYVQEDLLVNLYDYLNQEGILTSSSFLPNLLQALESSEHAIYRIPQSFSIATVVGRASVVGGTESWSLEDFYRLSSTHAGTVLSETDPSALLRDIVFQNFTLFVNYETESASFDSPTFIELLQFIQSIQSEEEPEYQGLEGLREEAILLHPVTFSRPNQYQEVSSVLDGDIACVGYPGAGGSSFYLNNPMAIPKNALNKHGAWLFLEFFSGSEYYTKMRGGWLPSRQKCLRNLSNAVMNGMPQENANRLQELIESIDRVANFDQPIDQILQNETQPFFDGAQSAERTAELIQKKVTLYLAEQRS